MTRWLVSSVVVFAQSEKDLGSSSGQATLFHLLH